MKGRTPLRVRLVDAWLTALSLLVPPGRRRDWLAEWRAEVASLAPAATAGAGRWELVRRVSGAGPDALHLLARRVGGGGWGGEVRHAVRGLVRRPGFTAVAVSTLALGIGANAALFSVVHAVLLRPLPFHEPERIVRLWGTEDGRRSLGGTVTYLDVQDLEGVGALEATAAFDEWRPALGGDGGPPEVVYGGTVDADFFDVLGVEAARGRTFLPHEAGEGREPAVVLDHGLWRRRFGADPDVVGATVRLNGTPYRVLGVLPPEFETPGLEGGSWGAPEVWRTVWFTPAGAERGSHSWGGVARLRVGVDPDAAQAEVDAAMASFARAWPDTNEGQGMALVPLREQLLGDSAAVLRLLLGAVGMVLLVACANVANLLLARSVERGRELAVRTALGASRARVVLVSLLESLLLAVVGAAGGVAVAWGGVEAVRNVAAGAVPRLAGAVVDGPVLLFAAGLAVATGLAFGAVAAFHALRALSGVAGPGGRGRVGDREGTRFRRGLVGAEVALSVVLLVGAGLLLRSLDRLYAVDLGMAREGVLTVQLHGSSWYDLSNDEARARYDAILEGVRALPGVRAAGAINILPLAGGFSCDGVDREDRPPPGPGEGPCAEVRSVFPGTLEAFGVTLVRGRDVTGEDGADAPGVVVVDRTAVREFWPGEDPLGKRVRIHGGSFEVVGVAGAVRHFGPGGITRPQVYMPAVQDPWNGASYGLALVARGEGSAEALVPGVRRAIADVDPDIAVESVRTLEALLAGSVADSRFRTVLLSAFAGLAVLLAVVGLAGVVAYSVRRRTREIGVRVALGAEPRRVVGLVVREGARVVGLGVAAGVISALVLADVLGGLVFGIGVRDPLVLTAAPVFLAAVALLAVWIPARRASRVDPVEALAAE